MKNTNKVEETAPQKAARIAERVLGVKQQMGKHAAACLNKDSRGQVRARSFLDQLIQPGVYLAHTDFRHLNGPLSRPEIVGVTGIVERDKKLDVAVYDEQGKRTYVSAMMFVVAVNGTGVNGEPYEGHAFELQELLTREKVERRYPFAASDDVSSDTRKAL